MIQALYARLREAWPINRVVTALTPLVFVPVAGFVATWVAANFPGLPPIDPGWLAGVFIVGATSALAAGYKWLDGWQKYEGQVADPDSEPIPNPGETVPLDGDGDLSQPSDIAESDADAADEAERRERIPDSE